MPHYYWNDWYSGWGWVLWFGFVFLMISGFGNWGYTYRAHRKYENGNLQRDAIDILNQRYAHGDISHEEYSKIKSAISLQTRGSSIKSA